MQKFILNTLLITLVFSASITLAETDVMCTQEAKQCPDGSYVGRTGPNCEFAKCPNSVSTSTSATPRQGLIQKLKNVIENKKEVREEVKNKIQDRVSSTTAQRIENRFEKIAIKYLRTIEREEAIMAKIVSRIEKIKEFLRPIMKQSYQIKKFNEEYGYIVNKWGTIIRPKDKKDYASFNNYIQSTATEILIDKLFEIKK